ncbi:MAG: hypothetical protein M0P22_10575 [Methanoculleus sp.]|nr:hypothetical protein [Methanoculleus sp.]
MALRKPHAAALLAAGCIVTILSAFLLFPIACAMVFPSLPAEEGDVPENASSLVTEPGNGTALLFEPVSDDERLESLIAGASIPLLELSVEQIHALSASDDAALRSQAAGMCSLVGSLRADVAVLEVSPENLSAHSSFIAALDEFAAAGTLLGEGIPMNRSVTDDALGRLALGTEHLADALQDCNRPPADSPDAVPVSIAAESLPAFPDALQSGERFCYDDARGENSASLIAGPITWSHTLQTTGTKPVQYTAESGKFYLLVVLRVTHLGHKGDGINTRLQTPLESAFTLYYSGETYRPLASPGPTSRGVSYSRVVLDRGGSVTGFLFFEVPEDLDPSHAYLQASIGKESPVWVLGRAP